MKIDQVARMEITIKFHDGVKWVEFDMEKINHMSRDHVVSLFTNPLAVIAEEGGTYLTNREEWQRKYQATGKRCVLFGDLTPSGKALETVGFTRG
jgi:hypothetical protein